MCDGYVHVRVRGAGGMDYVINFGHISGRNCMCSMCVYDSTGSLSAGSVSTGGSTGGSTVSDITQSLEYTPLVSHNNY